MDARDVSPPPAGEDGGTQIPGDPGIGDFRALIERLPLIAYIDGADPTSPNMWVSRQSTQMLGYTPEEWISRPDFFLTILHPDDRERVVAGTAHTIATGEPLEMEYRLLRHDGDVLWVRDEGVLVRDAAGRPVVPAGLHPRHHRAARSRKSPVAPIAAPTRSRPCESLAALGYFSFFWMSLTVIRPLRL